MPASRLAGRCVASVEGGAAALTPASPAAAAGAGAGWYGSIVETAGAMAGTTRPIAPDAAAHRRYRELIDIHRDVYAATRSINRRPTEFATGEVP